MGIVVARLIGNCPGSSMELGEYYVDEASSSRNCRWSRDQLLRLRRLVGLNKL